MKKIAMLLTLAVVICFGLVSLTWSEPPDWADTGPKPKPIWGITGAEWIDHAPNPRFAIYDNGTQSLADDDVVFDKETGLVWERLPETCFGSFPDGYDDAINCAVSAIVAGRMGWRLATIEELMTLHDPSGEDLCGGSLFYMPTGHPFLIGVDKCSTNFGTSSTARDIFFEEEYYPAVFTGAFHQPSNAVAPGRKDGSRQYWLVRGGHGYDYYH